ncbi:MAG: anthranilate phosphoribosyltransferase [Alphaproteobacteria bacterium]|nr:anthranilate phosphoribosyltransferase [Alphaproteobacteria bacterium]
MNPNYFNNSLSQQEAESLMNCIVDGSFNEFQIAAILGKFTNRNLTLDELKGFIIALKNKMLPVHLNQPNLIDIVGTGGDGKNSFNISTLACFVVAGAGFKVAKHGNFGASTHFGASHIMQFLGYQFSNDSNKLQAEIDQANVCFLHAPLFHPALKQVASIRKSLGWRTIFNYLGPLLNPATPSMQLIGVNNHSTQRLYNYYLQQTKAHFAIVHCLNGYDEISLTNETKILTNQDALVLHPSFFTKMKINPEHLFAETQPQQASQHFMNLLKSKTPNPQNQVVIANAALAIHIAQPQHNLANCFEIASEALYSGKALACLEKLLNLQK